MTADLQERLARSNVIRPYLIVAGVLSLLFISVAIPAGIALAIVLGLVAVPLYRWDHGRRTAQLIYDTEDREIVARLDMANHAGRALASAAAMWHIHHAVQTNDWKRNAGASVLLRRTKTWVIAGSISGIELNIQPCAVPVGPQQLLFLPDRLLVWDGRVLAGVPYEHLLCQAVDTQFVEEDWVASDAQVIDWTWRYVNKNGGPDRRYSNNRRLPVVRYGELQLATHSGLRIFLQTSSLAAAYSAAQALGALVSHAQAMAANPQSARTSPVQPLNELSMALMVLMRHVVGIDRRIDSAEVEFARHIHDRLPSATVMDPVAFDAWFRQLPADRASADAALGILGAADPDAKRWTLGVLEQMMASDGKLTGAEANLLAQARAALGA